MLVGLQSLAATQHPDTNVVLTKLTSLFCKSDFNWIEANFSRWGIDTAKEKELFELLKTAIIFKQTIQCEYYNSKGISSIRKINPLKLLYKDKAWYLFGFCIEKQGFRLFKIARIANAEPMADHFDIEYDYSIPITFDAESFGSIIDLELTFSCRVAQRVYDAFDNSFVRAAADGAFNVVLSMPETE